MRVLPGVLLTRARRFDPVRRLSMLDLPALERADECHFGRTTGGAFGEPRCAGEELCGKSHHRFIIRRAPNSLDVYGPVNAETGVEQPTCVSSSGRC